VRTESSTSIQSRWAKARFQYHLLVANRDLNGLMLRFDRMLAAMRMHLVQGVAPLPRSLGEIVEQAGVKSLLDVGCDRDPDFLRFLDRHLPGNVELVGVNLTGQPGRVGRIEVVLGEAADLQTLLAGRKFDLVTCNAILSHQTMMQRRHPKYPPEVDAKLIVEGGLAVLSDHQRAATIFTSYSQDSLYFSRTQFAEFGELEFSVPRFRNSLEVFHSVILTPKRK